MWIQFQEWTVTNACLMIAMMAGTKKEMMVTHLHRESETNPQRQLEFAITKRIPKVVFVHGVGEGVLKAELDFLLGRYENVSFYDASYKEYGFGATEVRIHQNARRR